MLALLLVLIAIPPEINKILQLRAFVGGKASGAFANPVSTDRLLTVSHASDGPFAVWEDRAGGMGVVVQLYRHPSKDLLMMRPAISGDEWMTNSPIQDWGKKFQVTLGYAKTKPIPGEEVFYLGTLPGPSPAVIVGRVLGYDNEGDLQIDGWAHPGCSGSGVLNSRGELVGIISGVANWASLLDESMSVLEIIDAVHKRALYKSTVYAVDLVGGWPRD